MSLFDRARPANDRGDTGGLEQASLGAEGDHLGVLRPGQFHDDPARFRNLNDLQPLDLADGTGDDVAVGTDGPHRRQEDAADIVGKLAFDVGGVGAVDGAHLPFDRTTAGNDVARLAALNATDLQRRPGGGETAGGRRARLHLLAKVEHPRDVAGRIFDRVDAPVRLGAMALEAGELGRVFVAALVALDDAHRRRLADDGDGRTNAGAFKFLHQRAG